MPPLVTDADTVAFACSGSISVTLPLVVSSEILPEPTDAMSIETLPLVVSAATPPPRLGPLTPTWVVCAAPLPAAPVSVPAQTGARAAAPAWTGATHYVSMNSDGKKGWFDPATLTIKANDVVRFHNKTGGPHNVSFWPDSIPSGAATALDLSDLFLPGAIPNGDPQLAIQDSTHTSSGTTIRWTSQPGITYRCPRRKKLIGATRQTITPDCAATGSPPS